jgi:ArsR family metal-binding transcriptional regulator
MNEMSNQKKIANKALLDAAQIKALDALTTTAAKVRFMATVTQDRGEISRYLSAHLGREVRYQWVRNVLITPLKKQG